MMMAMMMAIHSEAQTNKVYDKVEVMPEYPGGMEALRLCPNIPVAWKPFSNT